MLGYFKKGLVLLVSVAMCVCGGAASGSVSRELRHRRADHSSLLHFCRRTRAPVNLRHSLTQHLSSLQAAMKSDMTRYERSMIDDINTATSFSEVEDTCSLAEAVDRSFSNLLCMGRAMDILRPAAATHPAWRSRRPVSALYYGRHVLIENVRNLSGQSSFKRTYHEVLYNLQQLQRAVGGSISPACKLPTADDDCATWRGDPTNVLLASYQSVAIAKSLLNDVNTHCWYLELGSD